MTVATVAQAFSLAVQHHRAGNLPQAEHIYQQILQADPGHAETHHLLGVLAYQSGHYAAAVAAIRHALNLSPGIAAFHFNLGLAYEAGGQVDEAVAAYERALRLQPDAADAHNNLGNLLQQQGKTAEAIKHCRQALALRADFPEAHNNLGNALFAEGQVEEAIASFRRALQINPGFAKAFNNLGNAFRCQDKLDEAVRCYRQALQVNPNYAEAYYNCGVALERQRNVEEAIHCFRQAMQRDPNLAEVCNNLGTALTAQKKVEEGIGYLKEALRLKPNYAEAFNNLGIALDQQRKTDEALRNYRRAIELKPDFAEAHNNLGSLLLGQGQLDDALASFRHALCLQPDLATAQSNLLFCLNYHPEADPDDVFAEHCRWGKRCEAAASRLPFINDPRPERRLRVGYVSPDFRQHALARYFEPVLAHHDPEQVEVFCYAEVPFADAFTNRLQKLAHGWRRTSPLTDAQLGACIRDDRIDILVDLAGHTGNSRLRVFASKPAPVQATWLGYLNTTGLTTVDYRLTDAVLDPPGQPVRDTEELVRLPGGMCCFGPPEDAPPVMPLPALQRGYLTFGSLHNLFKLNAGVIDLWSRVLQALPTARLLMFRDSLTEAAQKHLREQFAQHGIADERLDLRQGSSAPGYLAIYGEIDMSLDVFPWAGGVTTCESLWMGVPVVSLCGVRPASRNAAAILSRVGMSAWAVETPGQYVALAARQAAELHQLAILRTQLRDRMRTTLCDAHRFTRELEEAFRTMWRRWCANRQ
jgi:protein O-GlcNAc transferase